MAFLNPSVADFKAYFFRDFPYGTDMATQVLDADITKAFIQTNINMNQALFGDQGSYSVGYNLMSAHFMVMNIRASSQGINGQFDWAHASKGAGAVSESFSIPQRILDNPFWSMLTKTNYGLMFLQLVLPQLSGQMFVSLGRTKN